MFKLTKAWKFGMFTALGVVLMAATAPAAIWITHTSGAQLENARRRCERHEHTTHQVGIEAGRLTPVQTDARLCDKLVITNHDQTVRLIAFGEHDSHLSYDGVSERLLSQGQALKITLIRKGDYRFHDHQHDETYGTFKVSE